MLKQGFRIKEVKFWENSILFKENSDMSWKRNVDEIKQSQCLHNSDHLAKLENIEIDDEDSYQDKH